MALPTVSDCSEPHVAGAERPVSVHGRPARRRRVATKTLDLEGMIFSNAFLGKMSDIRDIEKLYKFIPRKIRVRFDHQLARVNTACLKEMDRSSKRVIQKKTAASSLEK